MKRFAGDTNGVTAIEFALVCPALFLLVFGILELGRFIFAYNSMDAALAKAAREWMIDPAIAAGELESVFCSRTHLVDCSKTAFTFSTEMLDGRQWRLVTARAVFDSPVYPLIPLPREITVTERVPVYD